MNWGPEPKSVWLVFHGIGFLSKYFLRYFEDLDKDKNYIIAPQAPSKYYLNGKYRHVGASWLTRVDREQETQNVLNYVGKVLESENIPSHCQLIVFGFSQGVSIATRFLAETNLKCSKLILYAGGITDELKAANFERLKNDATNVYSVVSTQDKFINAKRLKEETEKLNKFFRTPQNKLLLTAATN